MVTVLRLPRVQLVLREFEWCTRSLVSQVLRPKEGKGTTNDPLLCTKEAKRTGFQTVFYADGSYSIKYVEDLSEDSKLLDTSDDVHPLSQKGGMTI